MKLKLMILLTACMAFGVFLPASASASTSCPSGKCYTEAAEWVPGTTLTASGGSASGGGSSYAIIRETPVSKLKKIKKSYEKKYKVVVGSYQNPNGYEGTSPCVDPTKVKRWHFHAGQYVKTTNHLREPVPPEQWKKGEKICGGKEVKINGKWWFTGTQERCSNVKTWIPIRRNKIRKPKVEYVQFPTMEKFYEVAIKRLEIKSASEGGSGEGGSASAETPGHWQCKPGGVLNGKTCKYCPPPSCEPPCTSCEEQPPCCASEGHIEFGNEFEFEEAHVNEPPIHYYIDVFAPAGDHLTVYFETEQAHFGTHEINVSSYGAQSKFESLWYAPSHPGQYPVWVKVVDHTSGEICESEVQWVTVLPWESEENPS